ncbi:hypothetical protein IPA_08440 [Ignicoccus pacificus DSM 13166]|uniref:Methyltransferase domain-containing protein n=1 Tax=Ignicoccus pacificus DSM 13166 TaxID=940294 RepID=A0A977KCZ3_9CREN|nr:hypothetical protein IPA_08440 [Ignicoccus pacificus DSM 13166]
MTLNLSEFYSHWKWPATKERFDMIKEFMEKEVVQLIKSENPKVLDVMAGSGIAGAALVEALGRGELTLLDLRDDEFYKVKEFTQRNVRTVVGDVRLLPKIFKEKFDVIVCWGSSIPHLDPKSLILFIAGAREVLNEEGVIVIEQTDLMERLIREGFQKMMVEGGEKDLLTLFYEYDKERGMIKKHIYKLPEISYVGDLEAKLWSTSDVEALVHLFFNKINRKKAFEYGVRDVIVGVGPRKEISWKVLFEGVSE